VAEDKFVKNDTCTLVDVRLQVERLKVTQEKDAQHIKEIIKIESDDRDKAIQASFLSAKSLVDNADLHQKIALDLKAKADEKHFEQLNNEADRIQHVLTQSVPREVWERDVKEINGKITAVQGEQTKFLLKDTWERELIVVDGKIKSEIQRVEASCQSNNNEHIIRLKKLEDDRITREATEAQRDKSRKFQMWGIGAALALFSFLLRFWG